MDFEAHFKELVPAFIARSWSPADGLAPALVSAADRRLGVPLPAALRAFYSTLGSIDVIVRGHHQVLSDEQLQLDARHLIFMEEHQGVVSWGIAREDLCDEDPVVWQRNNTPPIEWFSEEKRVTAFIESLLEWYAAMGLVAGAR